MFIPDISKSIPMLATKQFISVDLLTTHSKFLDIRLKRAMFTTDMNTLRYKLVGGKSLNFEVGFENIMTCVLCKNVRET